MAVEINDNNFLEYVAQPRLTVVDFWAEWCGPCRMISPIIEELSGEYDEATAVFTKLNVDHNQNVSMQYQIRSIPTILFFKNGEVIDKVVGVTSKAKLKEKVEASLSA